MTEKALKLTDVAEMLHVAAVTVRAWSDKGMLTPERTPGGHRRYRKEEVLQFAKRHNITIETSPSDSRLKILLVDDDPRWLALITTIISKTDSGIQIETASSGFAAGQKLTTLNPDIILLDIKMPGISGLEVCQNIRTSLSTARIIAISGHATVAEEAELIQAGAECCLRKPVDTNKLLSLIGLPN